MSAWMNFKDACLRAYKHRTDATAVITLVIDSDDGPSGSMCRVLEYGVTNPHRAQAIGQLLYMLHKERPDVKELTEVYDLFSKHFMTTDVDMLNVKQPN